MLRAPFPARHAVSFRSSGGVWGLEFEVWGAGFGVQGLGKDGIIERI